MDRQQRGLQDVKKDQQIHPSDKSRTETDPLYLHIPSPVRSEAVSTVQSETESQISWDYTVYKRHVIPRLTVRRTNHNIRASPSPWGQFDPNNPLCRLFHKQHYTSHNSVRHQCIILKQNCQLYYYYQCFILSDAKN